MITLRIDKDASEGKRAIMYKDGMCIGRDKAMTTNDGEGGLFADNSITFDFDLHEYKLLEEAVELNKMLEKHYTALKGHIAKACNAKGVQPFQMNKVCRITYDSSKMATVKFYIHDELIFTFSLVAEVKYTENNKDISIKA